MPKPKKLTDAQATRLVGWGQKRLGLEHWEISTVVADEPPAGIDPRPGALGATVMFISSREALVWVSPARCADIAEQQEMLLHELIHIALDEADCPMERHTDRTEHFITKRAADLLELYQRRRR